jgi:hypothetical protein
VLHDDARDGVEYIFGDRIAELTQDAGGSTWPSRAATGGASAWSSGRRAALGAAGDGLRAA